MLHQDGLVDDIVREYLSEDIPEGVYDLRDWKYFSGSGELRIGKVEIFSEGESNGTVINAKKTFLKIEVLNPHHFTGHFELAGRIKTIDGDYVGYFGSRLANKQYGIKANQNSVIVEVEFANFPLVERQYGLGFELKFNGIVVYTDDISLKFDVVDHDFFSCGWIDNNGFMLLPQNWK